MHSALQDIEERISVVTESFVSVRREHLFELLSAWDSGQIEIAPELDAGTAANIVGVIKQLRLSLRYTEPLLSPEQKDEWTAEKDNRRCQLIDKQIQGALKQAERRELAELQEQAHEHFDRVAPPVIDKARKLHQKLLDKMQQQDQ